MHLLQHPASRLRRLVPATIALLSATSAAQAAVNYSFGGEGDWNTISSVFKTTSLDPLSDNQSNKSLGDSAQGDFRRFAQTFQVSGQAYTVTDLYILTDDYASNATVNFRVYSVTDAVTKVSSNYYPAPGTVIWSGSFSQASANGNNSTFRIQLTGADQFILPANTGNAGYVFEVFTNSSTQTIDWGRVGTSISATYAGYQQTAGETQSIVDLNRPFYFAFNGTAASAIPEPSSAALAFGAAALGAIALRRRRHAA